MIPDPTHTREFIRALLARGWQVNDAHPDRVVHPDNHAFYVRYDAATDRLTISPELDEHLKLVIPTPPGKAHSRTSPRPSWTHSTERVTAAVSGADGVLCDRLAVSIRITRRGSMANWSGSFTVPAGAALAAGETYRLTTADGRTGKFVVDHPRAWGRGPEEVRFTGAGRFGR